jgi:hypothetical protein
VTVVREETHFNEVSFTNYRRFGSTSRMIVGPPTP